jgi:hypothetical protein
MERPECPWAWFHRVRTPSGSWHRARFLLAHTPQGTNEENDMPANPNHMTAAIIAKLIANKELTFHPPQTSMTSLGSTIPMLNELVDNSHGKTMPLSMAAMKKKLDLAAACLHVAVLERSRATGEESSRKQRHVEAKAAKKSMLQIRNGARFAFVAHGLDTARLDAVNLRAKAGEMKQRADELISILQDNSAALTGAPVTEWIHAVESARALIEQDAKDQAVNLRSPQKQAHGVTEALVLDVIESLRVGYWNDAAVLARLRLRFGGVHKSPVTTPPPATTPPAPTT